jgi:hypothetical protein
MVSKIERKNKKTGVLTNLVPNFGNKTNALTTFDPAK